MSNRVLFYAWMLSLTLIFALGKMWFDVRNGGRLATIKAPVPMTKRNLDRLQRMIADQLEPFVDGKRRERVNP